MRLQIQNYIYNLQNNHYNLKLFSIPEHSNIEENERADLVAKKFNYFFSLDLHIWISFLGDVLHFNREKKPATMAPKIIP